MNQHTKAWQERTAPMTDTAQRARDYAGVGMHVEDRLLRECADRIERLEAALDKISRHCAGNGETPADRGAYWAADIASAALKNGQRDD